MLTFCVCGFVDVVLLFDCFGGFGGVGGFGFGFGCVCLIHLYACGVVGLFFTSGCFVWVGCLVGFIGYVCLGGC